MSLNNAALLENATMNAATGGTTLQFASKGSSPGKNTLIVPTDTSMSLRRSINLSTVDPKVSINAPGGYTQARAYAQFNFPRTLSNGNVSTDTLRVEFATDRETSLANKQEMRQLVAQALVDSDFDEFFDNFVMD